MTTFVLNRRNILAAGGCVLATGVAGLLLPARAEGLRHWGFKEIRYGTTPGDRAFDLLSTLFPDARVAFIVRNPFNMLASAHSRPEGPRKIADVVRVCDRIATRFESFRRWHASGRVRSHWIVYEELAREAGGVHDLVLSRPQIREEVFRQLFAWAERFSE